MVSTSAREALDALTDRPFRRDTAISAGFPARALSELVNAGLMVRPLQGVLVRSGTPDTPELRAEAARMVLPEGAALCRGTAAWLMGVDARPPGSNHEPPPLECAVPRGRSPMRRPGLRCYTADLTAEDLTDVAGVPCTTPGRTAVDLARWSTPGMGLALLDAMARRGLILPADLLPMTERWTRERFIARARRLLTLCDPAAESYGESWLRLRFHDAGFPPPHLQISLRDAAGVERRRLDLGYPEKRYAWEYDGEEFHAGLTQEASDRHRRAEIEHIWGWTVVGVAKNLVLGPSLTLERAIGEVVGLEPMIRRRLW